MRFIPGIAQLEVILIMKEGLKKEALVKKWFDLISSDNDTNVACFGAYSRLELAASFFKLTLKDKTDSS